MGALIDTHTPCAVVVELGMSVMSTGPQSDNKMIKKSHALEDARLDRGFGDGT